jgi:hypothetical protein
MEVQREDLIWLAGLLEGEGSFVIRRDYGVAKSIFITTQMTDMDVIARVGFIMGTSFNRQAKLRAHWKNTFRTTLTGARAAELMELLRPFMGIRRQQQIDRALSFWKSRPAPKRKLSVEAKDDIRRRLAADETHSSIANFYGVDRTYISHIARGARGVARKKKRKSYAGLLRGRSESTSTYFRGRGGMADTPA